MALPPNIDPKITKIEMTKYRIDGRIYNIGRNSESSCVVLDTDGSIIHETPRYKKSEKGPAPMQAAIKEARNWIKKFRKE